MNWLKLFDERQQKEIKFSQVYVNEFEHGTDGHNAKVIIAKMAHLLDEVSIRSIELVDEVLDNTKSDGQKKTIMLAHRLLEWFK